MQNQPTPHDQSDIGSTMTPRPSMRRRGIALALAASLAFSQAGCTASGGDDLSADDKRAIGTVGGALLGALIGYEFLGGGQGRWLGALALGAAGAYGGQMLADRLTRFDKTAMQETAYHTLSDAPAGDSGAWANPNTGTNGSITPVRTFLDSQGRICREYEAEVQVDGETHTAREAACQTAAGHWVMYSTQG